MSDNAGGWPPVPPGSPGSQAPQGFPRPLPPGYEPVHHESPPTDPRFADRRRAQDSPWRRAERVSHPAAAGWHAGGPVPASYDGDPRELDGGQFYSPGQDGGRDDDAQHRDPGPADRYDGPDVYGQYTDDDGYDTGDRFVPGFADDGDDDQRGRGARRRSARRPDSRGQGPAGPRSPRRRRWRWIAPLAALLIILIPLAVGGAYAYSFYMSKYHPADYSGSGTGHVVVQVSSGDTPTSLGPKLQQLGVVASARAFVLAAEHSSNPNGLLPGFYGMREHMKASLAYAQLLNPKNLVQVTVTIPEGWRLSQVVAWLGRKSGIPVSAYDQVLKDPARLGLPPYADGKPEGYLFPATYEVVPRETALGVLAGMVQRFDQEAAAVNLPAAARQVHLTQGQVIIMASLVQAEGGRLSDYPKIARVIYNRLARGIPLQLDSTVLYGLDRYGILATDAQLTSDSPYNTYKHTGLTPGPIDNPGNAAIQAVLHPASGNWLYFVTVNPKTGETLFTASQAQFQQYRAELEQNLGQGGTGG
jgi:peptidoglycan lytic transglycosylase G